ncbi:hypothetical protein B0A50_01343 [Salinomyces thailandicus]|uniref:Vacuolar protein sorting-associated protein 51 homolog n=1 Tax=Salinomyces thailandicus TaxID=706561 RepID=A0A4U0UC64_9PEZI|nr:hypothetical protein B0A50_01343 [Salinomyces thailandica]
MSTIASPRPSISLSSRRTSTSTTRSASTSQPAASASAAGSVRRNRTALRDYYGLNHAAPADGREKSSLEIEKESDSELDKADFDPEAYVHSLLARDGLEGVLRVEASLVGEIRSLDGEKKALVYDNYSKLIAATDTIRSMREKMDPLTQTSTLVGDIEHISETAVSLSGRLSGPGGIAPASKQTRAQQTVRWALGAPKRLEKLVRDGQKKEAEAEWVEVSALLKRWNAVNGAAEVREACLKALGHEEEG